MKGLLLVHSLPFSLLANIYKDLGASSSHIIPATTFKGENAPTTCNMLSSVWRITARLPLEMVRVHLCNKVTCLLSLSAKCYTIIEPLAGRVRYCRRLICIWQTWCDKTEAYTGGAGGFMMCILETLVHSNGLELGKTWLKKVISDGAKWKESAVPCKHIFYS